MNNYSILTLDCIKDSKLIAYLAGIADAQKDRYVKIFPWETDCVRGDKLYIAISVPNEDQRITIANLSARSYVPDICGWMRVGFKSVSRKKYAYVYEISASQYRTKYTGVGTSLLTKLENENIDFIQFIPLESARSFYTRLGYHTSQYDTDHNGNSIYLYKVVNAEPSERFIKAANCSLICFAKVI